MENQHGSYKGDDKGKKGVSECVGCDFCGPGFNRYSQQSALEPCVQGPVLGLPGNCCSQTGVSDETSCIWWVEKSICEIKMGFFKI